jgi:NDP-hexose 2,3-enoyl reductase
MDYVYLGRSGQQISRLVLGTLNFGVRATKKESFELMDAALDAGINVFDTADDYGWQRHRGFTEELLGEWFALGGDRRHRVVLGTKVCHPMSDWPNDRGLSGRHIIAACDDSLRRLRTDWIDLYQMHDVDPHSTWEEVWQAMEVLTRAGKVRYVGSSNFAGWNIAAAQERAARRGIVGLVSEQCLYNLVDRHAETEIMPAAAAYGMAVVAWSPLHGGLLGGVLGKTAAGTAVKSAQGRAQAALPRMRHAVERFEELCRSLGRPPADVAHSWVLSRPGVDAAVIGPRTREHLAGALAATRLRLPDEVLGELETLFR